MFGTSPFFLFIESVMRFAVIIWCETGMLLECILEMGLAGKAEIAADFSKGFIRIS